METEAIALYCRVPTWRPERAPVPARLTGGTCVPYGLKQWGDLFTRRQLVSLTTFSDLVEEARDQVRMYAIAAGNARRRHGLRKEWRCGATAYAEAVSVYLGMALSRLTDICNASLPCGNFQDTGAEFIRSSIDSNAVGFCRE